MKIFKDRQSAGKLLAKRLTHLYYHDRDVIVLGIPRGGVVVAAEVAKELKLPLDIIITRKIGAPYQPELALGAVDADGEVVGDVGEVGEIGEIIKREINEIKRREKLYRGEKSSLEVSGKTVILVDDGIATGATTLAAIRFLKRHKAKKIILAVPVASREAVERVMREIGPASPTQRGEEIIVLETPDYFQAVGQFYQEFGEVTDQEVVYLLNG